LVVKHHGIVGKSSRSIVSTTTDATCVPTDVSECSDDYYDGSSVILVDAIDASYHKDETEDVDRNSDRRQPASSPPVSIVDLLSDPIDSSTSVESGLGEDGIKKPPSLPSLLTPETKKDDAGEVGIKWPTSFFTPETKKDDAGKGDIRKGDKGRNGNDRGGDVIKKKAKGTKEKSKGIKDKAKGTVAAGQRSVVVVPESEYNAKRRAMIRKKRRTAPVPVPAPEKEGVVRELYVPPAETERAVKKRKRRRKKKRERKAVVGAMGGMVAGGVLLGPLGVVLGAAVGGFCTKQAAKKAEKRDQRKREQQAFRDYATSKALQWHLNDHAAVFV